MAIPNRCGKQLLAVCPYETFPLSMAVDWSLLSPTSHFFCPEESQIYEDDRITEFSQLPCEELRTLAESYPPQEKDALFELAQRYRCRDEREVLEIAAIAADVSLDSVINLGLDPDADPLFKEAFNRQYPNVDIESLVGASDQRLDGLADGVKGKYFEMLVCARLNAGERLGELQLQPGQTAHLAESSTQSGWDLRVENEDGSIDELLQLKATESMGYVKEALLKHPDIRVVVPSEVDAHADDVLGTDISNEQLLYSNCKQQALSGLRHLGRGSVIAFGSGKKVGGRKEVGARHSARGRGFPHVLRTRGAPRASRSGA